VAGGDHDAGGEAAFAHGKREHGGGAPGVAQQDRDFVGRKDSGQGRPETFRKKAGVVTDGHALPRRARRLEMVRQGLADDAHMREGEILGDEGAPAVGAEADGILGMNHGCVRAFQRG